MSDQNADYKQANPRVKYFGVGESRTLETQNGKSSVAALAQQAMSEEGGVYTVSFSVIPPTDGAPYVCEATISASERGNSVRRRINVVDGTSISLPLRVVDIRIRDVTPATMPVSGDNTPGAGSTYRVSAVVERGTRALGSFPPTLWAGLFEITSSAAEVLDIPLNSGVSSIQVCVVNTNGTPNMVVSFVSGTGIWKEYNPTVQTDFVPIPPGATQVSISNANPDDGPVTTTVTWGIDG